MGKRIILGSLLFFVLFASAAILGFLDFIPDSIAVIIGIASLLFLLISRLQFHMSGGID